MGVNPKTNRLYLAGADQNHALGSITVIDPGNSAGPSFALSTDRIPFGSRPIGLQGIKHVTLQNAGGLPVQVAPPQITGANLAISGSPPQYIPITAHAYDPGERRF